MLGFMGMLVAAFGGSITFYAAIRKKHLKPMKSKIGSFGALKEMEEQVRSVNEDAKLERQIAYVGLGFTLIGVLMQMIYFVSTYVNG
ncbi:MAG: hypothetical protein UHX00_15140 [Caryophanon sp.]|nr:hypothetical protein [Caryophanon sp.]